MVCLVWNLLALGWSDFNVGMEALDELLSVNDPWNPGSSLVFLSFGFKPLASGKA